MSDDESVEWQLKQKPVSLNLSVLALTLDVLPPDLWQITFWFPFQKNAKQCTHNQLSDEETGGVMKMNHLVGGIYISQRY